MWMSIAGMYEYDNSLFDGLDIPTYEDEDHNIHVIDKNTVINNIILKCAELEIVYPSLDTMKLAIGVWSAANQESWYKLIETQFIKFNPIWNVDANVEHTERVAGSDNRTVGGNVSTTPNITDENSVQGFNSSTWANAEKNVRSGNVQEYSTTTDNATDDHTTTFKETRTGNIGVTASQDLIQKQRDIAEFNIIDYIADSFKKRFCLMVY